MYHWKAACEEDKLAVDDVGVEIPGPEGVIN